MFTDIIFDLDHTLFVSEKEFFRMDDKTELSLMPDTLHPEIHRNTYYAINKESMGLIFAELLNKSIVINFITRGSYRAEHFTPILEKLYDLPKDSLKKCQCISNRYPEDRGEAIQQAQQQRIISADAKILVVDDLSENIDSVKKAGFAAIYAGGYPESISDMDYSRYKASKGKSLPIKNILTKIKSNFYLQQIIDACKLDIVLPENLNLTSADEQLIVAAAEATSKGLIAVWSRRFDLVHFLRFVNQHKFNLADLTSGNAEGKTPISLACSLQDIKLVQALLMILGNTTEQIKSIIAENEVRRLLYKSIEDLQSYNLLRTIERIKSARDLVAQNIKNPEHLFFDKRIATKGYFNPAIKKLESEYKNLHSLKIQSAYANEIISAAVESFAGNANKFLFKPHEDILRKGLIAAFASYWSSFADYSREELQPFFAEIIDYIRLNLFKTSFFQRVFNFSSAGLYLKYVEINLSAINFKFSKYQPLRGTKKLEIPICLPIINSRNSFRCTNL